MNRAKAQMQRARKQGLSALEVAHMRAIAKKEAQKMEQEATRKAFIAMLAIPLNVLVNDYWVMTGKELAPQFIDDVISLFDAWQSGVVSETDMLNLLWDYAGVTIDEVIAEHEYN